jgi:hypothetical protein
MRNPSRVLLPLCAALLAIAGTAGEAAAKCAESLGRPLLPGYVLIVDGKIVGEYDMDAQAEYPPADQVVSVQMLCRLATTPTGSPAKQAAVVVVTRDGAPSLYRTYLVELVDEQQAYRERTGEFAPDLTTLGFFEQRLPLAIEMEATATGWSATLGGGEAETLCAVAVGSARPLRPRQTQGVPSCYRE